VRKVKKGKFKIKMGKRDMVYEYERGKVDST